MKTEYTFTGPGNLGTGHELPLLTQLDQTRAMEGQGAHSAPRLLLGAISNQIQGGKQVVYPGNLVSFFIHLYFSWTWYLDFRDLFLVAKFHA